MHERTGLPDQLFITKAPTRKPEASRLKSVRNNTHFYLGKPAYGTCLWTSTLRLDGRSDWVDWVEANNFIDDNHTDLSTYGWWKMVPVPSCRLLVIDSLADLQAANWCYALAGDWEYSSYRDECFNVDFVRMACEGYDGLHLTENGNSEVHLSYPLNLNSWDVESTCWFRWRFAEIERLAMPEREGVASCSTSI